MGNYIHINDEAWLRVSGAWVSLIAKSMRSYLGVVGLLVVLVMV